MNKDTLFFGGRGVLVYWLVQISSTVTKKDAMVKKVNVFSTFVMLVHRKPKQ